MQDGIAPRIAWRVVDSNTGAVVIPNLFHLHQSKYTVRALHPGMPGSATLGDFSIALPPAASDDGRKYASERTALAYGQRVEGFLGDVITGAPDFSGVITGLRPSLSSPCEVTGSDSLWWLQQSQEFQGEAIGPGRAWPVFNNYRHTREVVADQVAPTGTPSGTWSTTAADAQFGIPAAIASAAGAYWLTTETWPATGEYNWPTLPTTSHASSVTVWATCNPSLDTGVAGSVECVFLSDGTTANCYLAQAVIAYDGAGNYNVSAQIGKITATVFSVLATTSNVFTAIAAPIVIELAATLYNLDGPDHHVVQLFINGKNANCQALITDAAQFRASGAIGYRFSLASGAGSTSYYKVKFESRTAADTWGTARFKTGVLTTTGTAGFERFDATGQTHLDMLGLAATLDGFQIRKTPGFGFKADVLDYTATPGSDRSAVVVFEQGVNVEDSGTQVAPVADLYATVASVNAVPGGSSGGKMTWSRQSNGEAQGGNPAGTGDLVLTDTVADLGTPGFALLAAYGMQVAARKAVQVVPIQLSVLRTADLIGEWRELDSVTVHVPDLGIYRRVSTVLGYACDETKNTWTVWLDEWPDRALVQLAVQRIGRAQEYLVNTYAAR